MIDEEWSLDPDAPEDRALIDSLLAAKRAGGQQRRDEPCPVHEEHESLIWAYADGFLDEDEEEQAWAEISQCRHCLDRLAVVQRALQEAEAWMEVEPEPIQIPEPVPGPAAVPAPTAERILALFNVEWIGTTIHRVGQALAVTKLQPVPVMGEEAKKNWRGQLSHEWNDLHVTIKTEVSLEPEGRPRSIEVSIDFRDQAGQPASRIQVDFCDVRGGVMQTRYTDDRGHVQFSSQEGQRFVAEDTPAEIGFCLEATRGDKTAGWQIVVGREGLDMTTMTD